MFVCRKQKEKQWKEGIIGMKTAGEDKRPAARNWQLLVDKRKRMKYDETACRLAEAVGR